MAAVQSSEALRRAAPLIGAASSVETMPFEVSSRIAYRAASEEMLLRSDLLLAAWNGQPSRSAGDTADVVGMARVMGRPTELFWPSPAETHQTG